MIFITVGTQAGFDRLIKEVDDWLENKDIECFAQIGKSEYTPQNMNYKAYLTEQEFNEHFSLADFVISHAGMGTIISCLNKGKTLLTLPRLAQYREHRNDHQISTTKAFSQKGYIYPIYTNEDLLEHLEKFNDLSCLHRVDDYAQVSLTTYLKSLV